MANHRHYIRVDDGERCNLRLGDSYFLATVKNISLGGALMEIYFPPKHLKAGNSCQVSLDGGSLYSYDCEVVRVENSKIALRFLNTHAPDVVH